MQQNPPLQPSAGPPSKPNRSSLRDFGIGCGCLVAVLIGLGIVGRAIFQATGLTKPGATHTAAGAAATPKKPTRPPIVENLKFTGQVKGTLTEGLNPRGISKTDTNPSEGFGPFDATQCTNGPSGFEADLYGQVGGKLISLRITYGSDDTVIVKTTLYTKVTPQISLWGADATVDKGYTIHGLYLEYPSAAADSTVTVAPDRRTGSMVLHITDMPYGDTILETIRGSWRCA
ncbi:MAG: hypothetical protein JWR24_5128 [Actinoallomurus sp.]|nr:hypothetical protein [Actinoallomurus sp.]